MLLELRVVDSPSQPLLSFSTFIDNAAHRYANPKQAILARECQRHAENACNHLKSYRQPKNGFANSRLVTHIILFRLTLMECVYMAKKPIAPVQNTMPNNLTFLNYRLTEEQLAEFDQLKVTPAQLIVALNSALLEGYRFSFSYNKEKKTANAMFADTRPDSLTYQHALSAYSDDCLDALKLLLYKHQIILSGEWSSLLTEAPITRRRG